MQNLTSSQRGHLRGLAHHLDPVAKVGKHGLTDAMIEAVDQALEAHELIKVRFIDFKDEKREICAKIVERTGCAQAGLIGHVAIFYRQHPEQKKRKIDLPKER